MEQNKPTNATLEVDAAAERARAAATNIATNAPITATGATSAAAAGEIRQLIEEFADSIRSGKIEDIISFYDPSLVAFDFAPPLRFTSVTDYKKNWETFFTQALQFPVTYEFNEEKIFASGDVGVFHAIIHTAGTFLNPPQGQDKNLDCWGRYTCALKKTNNRWRIVHEHFSVPVDESGKALMDLKPGAQVPH